MGAESRPPPRPRSLAEEPKKPGLNRVNDTWGTGGDGSERAGRRFLGDKVRLMPCLRLQNGGAPTRSFKR